MSRPFTAENWAEMDDPGRIVFCHIMARTAIKLAKNASFNVSEAFLELAESWSALASEITRSALEPPNRIPEPLANA